MPVSKDLMFDAPIPGQSLTASPDNKMPYERPPQFTEYDKAREFIMEKLIDDGENVVDFISQGVPIETLTEQVVFSGFAKGKWNPDLMTLLIEPTMYTLMFIAEQAGVDYVMSFDEDVEFLGSEEEFKAENYLHKVSKKASEKAKNNQPSEKIPSLLSKVAEGEGNV